MEHSHALQKYTCTMHPQISEDKSGNCPICGMSLVIKKNDIDVAHKNPSMHHEGHKITGVSPSDYRSHAIELRKPLDKLTLQYSPL